MNEKKHIDRLFQEKFKNFEATPDDAVWDHIHNALHKEAPKRRVIPIWWWTGGVAAALILLFALRPVLFSNAPLHNSENEVVGTEKKTSGSGTTESPQDISKDDKILNSNRATNSSEVVDTKKPKNKSYNSKDAGQSSKASSIVNNTSDKTPPKSISNIEKTENTLAQHTSPSKDKNEGDAASDPTVTANKPVLSIATHETTVARPTERRSENTELVNENNKSVLQHSESIEEAIANAHPIFEEEQEAHPNRWNISPNVAPVYFNSLGKGSTIHSQFVDNSKSGEIHMSYGISGSYAINDRVKIRAGINKVDLGYRTNEVVAFRDVQSFSATSGAETLPNINFNEQGRADAYMSISHIKNKSVPQFLISNPAGTLEQQFGYIEVPLEVEYSLINKTLGLNVIGGFSTLFLDNNNVYSVLGSERSLLGDANNINATSYSANFGLGVHYNLSSTLKLNLEPMFKYQINTFNNTSGDFRPYFIGVYSGFSFKF